MVRKAANGAIISGDGHWYFNGFKFKPLAEGDFKKPSLAEWSQANEMSTVASASSGKNLAKLVAEHGSLQEAEKALGGPPPEPDEPKQQVVIYKNRKEFEKASNQMIAAGWRVASTETDPSRMTATRILGGAAVVGVLTGGIGSLVGAGAGAAAKKKGAVQVVWERD
ncbi:hypothetical protein [Nocardiopsis kunsanensis]|uniref:hypothetical protein n=1 Tax=Nocardiopsis kunsanensis TaxID=141693 RepID=UPI00034AE20D|nr:hypothetical protein [Nocardiopsis kunsanensis]